MPPPPSPCRVVCQLTGKNSTLDAAPDSRALEKCQIGRQRPVPVHHLGDLPHPQVAGGPDAVHHEGQVVGPLRALSVRDLRESLQSSVHHPGLVGRRAGLVLLARRLHLAPVVQLPAQEGGGVAREVHHDGGGVEHHVLAAASSAAANTGGVGGVPRLQVHSSVPKDRKGKLFRVSCKGFKVPFSN